MKNFVKSTIVLAEQFAPTKEQKKSIIKDPKREKEYLPEMVMGCDLRQSNGEYFISKNIGNELVTLSEGQWLVNDGDKFSVVSNENFEANYKAQVEVKVSKKSDTPK